MKDEAREREQKPIEELAAGYEYWAQQALAGLDEKSGQYVQNEISQYTKQVATGADIDEEQRLQELERTLARHKPSLFDAAPDEKRERLAFALALVHARMKSLQ